MTIAKYGRQAKSAFARWAHQMKRPQGLCLKLMFVVALGLCFVFIWAFVFSTPNSVAEQRESFGEIAEPATAKTTKLDHSSSNSQSYSKLSPTRSHPHHRNSKDGGAAGSKKKKKKKNSHHLPDPDLNKENSESNGDGTDYFEEQTSDGFGRDIGEGLSVKPQSTVETVQEESGSDRSEDEVVEKERMEDDVEGEEMATDGKDDGLVDQEAGEGDTEGDEESKGEDDELAVKQVYENVSESGGADKLNKVQIKETKLNGPLFDTNANYSWKVCSVRTKHNYIPCIDLETVTRKTQLYRHHERSCHKVPPMCLVPLPPDGYLTPIRWPESKLKIMYKNVAHAKLAAFMKTQTWLVESGEYLTFPQNETSVKGGGAHYIESIGEMVPDIEWGKNLRVVLDIGCSDSSFAAIFNDKEVLVLSLGLKDDLVDLAQLALERGFPVFLTPFATRRLPFPSAVFDAIHCGGCNIHWNSNGGKLLLEMNRILRPGGYFIMSSKHNSIEEEEAMSSLTASICWNILTDKADEVSEVAIKIYQKPESNEIYDLRRKKNPPMCQENEKPDAAWYVPITHCLHHVPSAIEHHGTEWPAEWPNRLETYPDWLENKEKVKADSEHWKAIVEKSYLTGLGINWKSVRNVMDMKAIYGGFAAALSEQNVWVMSVVPVQAPNTLPFIFERGLFGVYHDWCEPFGTYPRSYDLLHADHLFARLKKRCKYPVGIVVEMDRILRPGGWVIVRDKVEIVVPLEGIMRSMKWDIRMTFAQGKEGILVAQKTLWRP